MQVKICFRVTAIHLLLLGWSCFALPHAALNLLVGYSWHYFPNLDAVNLSFVSALPPLSTTVSYVLVYSTGFESSFYFANEKLAPFFGGGHHEIIQQKTIDKRKVSL